MKKFTTTNTITALSLRILGVILIFTLCRALFLYTNTPSFPNLTPQDLPLIFAGGFLFDLSAILYLNLLYILLSLIPGKLTRYKLYQKFLFCLFTLSNSLGIAANCFDSAFFPYTLRRTTASIFKTFKNENLSALFSNLISSYWHIIAIWLALSTLLVFLYTRISLLPPTHSIFKPKYHFATHLFTVLFTIAISIIGIRGGIDYDSHPINLNNAGEYTHHPKAMAIVLNTPFTIIRTLIRKDLPNIQYFSQAKAEQLISPLHPRSTHKPQRNTNVVIIILESFNREYLGQGFTPFLDSLLSKGHYFSAFANGRSSIDAFPSILMGIPAWDQAYALSPYVTNTVNSLPKLLRDEGYHTAFFHGAPNGSMGFQAMSKIAGFSKYYGQDEYPDPAHYDGYWGIWDEEFFQFFADHLHNFPEPFFVTFFSLSSHHPYKIPPRYTAKFPSGSLPIHQTVTYTDYALQKFFVKIQKSSWFKNTIFVITADHCNAQNSLEDYNTDLNAFAIPLLLYDPSNQELSGHSDLIAQQIDIMPTVLRYLNYDKAFFAFGRNLLAPPKDNYAINYLGGVYQLIKNDHLLQFDLDKSLALYNFKQDPELRFNLVNSSPNLLPMENFLKAFIQQFFQRVRQDQLTIRKKHQTQTLNTSADYLQVPAQNLDLH